jgi:hypothetical protein
MTVFDIHGRGSGYEAQKFNSKACDALPCMSENPFTTVFDIHRRGGGCEEQKSDPVSEKVLQRLQGSMA